MATTRRDGKEKRGLSPTAIQTKEVHTHARPSSKSPSTARPANNEQSSKPEPNYLRPTFSSSPDLPRKQGNKTLPLSSMAVGRKLTRLTSLEKPPSPSSAQPRKLVAPGVGKDRDMAKSLTAVQRRAAVSSQDKTIKTSPKTQMSPGRARNGLGKRDSRPQSPAGAKTATGEAVENKSVIQVDAPLVAKMTTMEEEELLTGGEAEQCLLDSIQLEDQIMEALPDPEETEDPVTKVQQEQEEVRITQEERKEDNQRQPNEEIKDVMSATAEIKDGAEEVVNKKTVAMKKKEATAYNDVIEETASKLVGQRKSKVLALVGAFETVISLQEPAAPPQVNIQHQPTVTYAKKATIETSENKTAASVTIITANDMIAAKAAAHEHTKDNKGAEDTNIDEGDRIP